jgi:hypothetical protein
VDRLNFYTKEVVNSISELDFLNNSLSKFTLNYDVNYYLVNDTDLMRPDMISYKNYGTVNYWWIICYINNIFNPFNDLYVGQQLKIPNVIDIYEFYRQYGIS